MNVFEIVSDNCESKHYLAEGWQTLTESQKRVIRECERELWPLMESLVILFEQRLKPEEIEKLFTAAEETSTGKKTGIGKAASLGKDTIQKINQKINELGKKLQDTKPVQNFDSQFEKLKQDIKQKAGDDSKIIKQVEKYGDWAKENPGKTAFVIGVLTAAAAFAGGPAGGAAVGFLLRSANEMLKGEKASSAAGKAVKTAAIGALVGAGLDAIGDTLAGGLEAQAVENFPDMKSADLSFSRQGTGIPDTFLNAEVYGRPEDVEFVVDKFNSAVDSMQSENFSDFESDWSEMQAKINEMNQLEYMEDVVADSDAAVEFLDSVDKFREFSDAISATAQAAAQEASAKSESINEDLKDKIKGAAGNVKKQATQAVTKQKLMKAWEKQGKPLDYGSIVKIMQSLGLSSDEISQVSQSANVELPVKGKNKNKDEQESEIKPGASMQAADGSTYEWKGAQWVNKKTGRIAKKEISQELTKKAKADSSQTFKSQDKDIKINQTVQGPDGVAYDWKGAQWVNSETGKVAKKQIAQQLTKTAKADKQPKQQAAAKKSGNDVAAIAQQIKQAGLSAEVKKLLQN